MEMVNEEQNGTGDSSQIVYETMALANLEQFFPIIML